MIDSLGTPQTLLLLGGTSDIALATAERWSTRPGLRVVVAARPSPERDEAVLRLKRLGADATGLDFEAREPSTHQAVVQAATAVLGDIDVAVVAFGVLGDEEASWQFAERAVEIAEVNYVAAVSCGVVLARRLREQGHGAIVALSSVAGERVRRANFVYGSSKAGMDGFYLGLADAVRADGVRVVVVRPGFVRSAMTAGRDDAPMAVDPSDVADAIADAVARGRELVWVPSALRYVMSGLRHVPRPLFRRLPL